MRFLNKEITISNKIISYLFNLYKNKKINYVHTNTGDESERKNKN